MDEIELKLTFSPVAWNRGQTYYYTIILAEENSETVFNEYLCIVTVTNGLSSRPLGPEYIDITYTVMNLF